MKYTYDAISTTNRITGLRSYHPLSSQTYNISYHESIKTTPSNANYGFSPDAFHEERPRPINPKALLSLEQLKELHNKIKEELEWIQSQIKRYYN